MAKKQTRTRSVQSPKAKGKLSPRDIERAVRAVADKLAAPSDGSRAREKKRAAAGGR